MAKAKKGSASLPTEAKDLSQLVIGYAKQEILDPVKNLGRFLALGLAAAVVLGVGLMLLLLSGLRALQTETGDTFTDEWSWVPYLIVLVGAAIVAGGVMKARTRGQARKREAH